ncbi:MAG: hypothetical protein LBJ11_08685 [Oscillospiraceae bacterium]|jgi:hypothetical protein|nr:hypothetical protein [Oscillospiraceae bacterium]
MRKIIAGMLAFLLAVSLPGCAPAEKEELAPVAFADAVAFYENNGYTAVVGAEEISAASQLLLASNFPGAVQAAEIKSESGKALGNLVEFPSEETYQSACVSSLGAIQSLPKRGLVVLQGGDKDVKQLFGEIK